MNKMKRLAAVGLAGALIAGNLGSSYATPVLTSAAQVKAAPGNDITQARWYGGWGWGVGAFVGGLALGAALAPPYPYYYGYPYAYYGPYGYYGYPYGYYGYPYAYGPYAPYPYWGVPRAYWGYHGYYHAHGGGHVHHHH